MSKQTVNLGALPTGVGGDTPRAAFVKMQANFNEIYNQLGGDALPPQLPIASGGTGNSTGTAAKLAASAILGTVAQSGGLPTGALMEYTSSGNGQAWKFANGLMICSRSRSYGLVVGDFTIYGNIWYYYGNWTYPVPFAFPPVVTGSARGSGRVNALNGDPNNNEVNCNFFVVDYASPVVTTVNEKIIAIGRWY